MESLSSNRFAIASGADWQGLYMNGVLMVEGYRLSARDVFAVLGLTVPHIEVSESWLEANENALPMQLSDVKEKLA